MSDFFTIFQPGLEHLNEERERLQHDKQIPGDAAPPNIDLDGGVAYLGSGEVVLPERPRVRPREDPGPADLEGVG